MSDEGRQGSDDVKAFTEEDVARRSALGIRWFRGESFATIAQTEGLDVETVEGLLRGLMKGVHAVSRRERDEARAKSVEYIGETRRLRRLAAHVAKGGFGVGALIMPKTMPLGSGWACSSPFSGTDPKPSGRTSETAAAMAPREPENGVSNTSASSRVR
jgi:hypothetical protein